METPFYHDVKDYKDVLDPVADYIKTTAHFIKRTKGCSEEEAYKLTMEIVSEEFKDRDVSFFLRKDNGDRTMRTCGIYRYIKTHVKEGNIIAPSFTTFYRSDVVPSVIADYIATNVALRAESKSKAAEYKASKNTILADSFDRDQNNKKGLNNAVSGLMGSKTSAISNQSAHSVLTSATRTITSLSNANNERFISDNRLFLSPVDVINSIITESARLNVVEVRTAIDQFNLHIPTVEETIDVLKRSSDLYWTDDYYYQTKVKPFLSTLTEEEITFVVYGLSLYNLVKFNDKLMRDFFNELTFKVTSHPEKMDDPDIIKNIDISVVYLAHGVFSDEIKGLGKKYSKMNELGIANNLYHTCLNINNTIEKYGNLLKAFVRVDIAPINSHRLEYMRRRTVVLSDTDSSAFSTDELVKWMHGDFVCNGSTIALTSAVTYMVSESIVHQLTRFSKSSNVEDKFLRKLAMKNEYFWSGHVPAYTSKHYYADTIIKEGNVYPDSELEIKGVHLRNSTISVEIIQKGNRLIDEILTGIRENKPLNLSRFIQDAIDLENGIIEETMAGSTSFLRRLNINDASSYGQGPEQSNYRYHTFWEEAMEVKYGDYGKPPYVSLQIPLKLNNKTEIAEWLESIKDPVTKKSLTAWITRTKRSNLPNVYMNSNFIIEKGIPDEFKDVVDVYRVVKGMTTQLSTILSTMNVTIDPDMLIKDQFTTGLEK